MIGNIGRAELQLVFILGAADLSVPKRFGAAAQSDKPAALSDIERISELISTDFQGRLHISIACRDASDFVDQLKPLKGNISVRIFGSSFSSGRLREFTGLDLDELNAHDMGLIRRNDSSALIFKPFDSSVDVT